MTRNSGSAGLIAGRQAAIDLFSDFIDRLAASRGRTTLGLQRSFWLEPLPIARFGRIGSRAVEDEDRVNAWSCAQPLCDCCAARLITLLARMPSGQLILLADDQQVAAALRAEDGRGRVLDRDRVAQPGRRRGSRGHVGGLRCCSSS